MGAARRWKLLPFRSASSAASNPKPRVADVLAASPSPPRKEEEEVPEELLCPILRAPMADPVILPSGRTYERTCVRACAELGLAIGPDGGVVAAEAKGTGGGDAAVPIPNDALRAAVRTWCARFARAPPVAPSAEEAREAVLRAVAARSASNLSCSTSRASAASTLSSSSGGSSREIAAGEVEAVVRAKPYAAEEIEEADAEEGEAVATAVEKGGESEVEAAVAALRHATREGEARRRALCTPRLLAALRRVLLSARHTAAARADAAAALANLALEPENRVPFVRAGAVPALVDALASPSSAREHAAGALFCLALDEANRAAVGVLGAVPPLLALFAGDHHSHSPSARARRDAGTALYHLSLAAVNQCKLARAPGACRTLLSVASNGAEPASVRRLALMVILNVTECAVGRAALMDAGAVATVSSVLSDDHAPNRDLQPWCVTVLFGMSRGSSARFRGLARAAGAGRPLATFAEHATPGVQREMAETMLRVILGVRGDTDGDLSDGEGSSSASARPPHRRRAASWAAAPPAATPPSTHQWRSVWID